MFRPVKGGFARMGRSQQKTPFGRERKISWCIAGSPEFRKMLWGLPPIHFGKEDGVERTLLRVACQSDFDELVSLVFRPVYRGSCRRRCFSTSFYPVQSHFAGWKASKLSFVRRKAGLPGRKHLITKVQAQASRPIELGAALEL